VRRHPSRAGQNSSGSTRRGVAQGQTGDGILLRPYTHSRAILYGAQSFSLRKLFKTVEQ
jgi:hypothetical protein